MVKSGCPTVESGRICSCNECECCTFTECFNLKPEPKEIKVWELAVFGFFLLAVNIVEYFDNEASWYE